MPALSARLQLPLGNYEGARGSGTIKTIQAGTFQTVDDRLPVAVSEMLVSYNNAAVFNDNEAVTI